jgi:phenylacetate-CoA ligase
MEDAELDQCLDVLDRQRVRHLWGYPSSLFYLAQRARRVGFNRPLTSVVTWGDQLFPHYREAIESAFKTQVHDTYGCGEGIQIAAQCGTGTHYHVHSLDVIVEFLDDSGEPVAEGEPGNIVLTRLHAGPMPFIRYQVGDVGVDSSSVVCSCGRGFQTMKSVVGRTADVISTPSGNRLIVHFFTGVLEHFAEIDTFQVVQTDPGSLLLRIVPAAGYGQGSDDRIRSALVARGADLRIDIEKVDRIPLTSGGKRRFVIRS